MRSLGEIAHGITSNLLTRAADVALKERRKLALVTHETPLHAIHLRIMSSAQHGGGGLIAPPRAGFPQSSQDPGRHIDHTIGRALDHFDLDPGNVKRRSRPRPPPL